MQENNDDNNSELKDAVKVGSDIESGNRKKHSIIDEKTIDRSKIIHNSDLSC